ncbi:hypothetical protein FISHEDRAFT_48356 [Fistulina hepatica ATCC 64428]|uniref:Xylanolytic transcriptional activator regulatory domain-containing protein n=1 Tax=Fistulina hepatica ATCC 64428 TaxID=1128425 RepID=A0A0D7A4P1_9AGAR|nr:hypothetical protein FISHEDRAFT_48356 [Fistulina hepatica ATCC 64428]
MCYQDARGHDGSTDSNEPQQCVRFIRIDPALEISRLRQAVSQLESYIFANNRNYVPLNKRDLIIPKREADEPLLSDKGAGTSSAPGMLGNQVQGGLYAGATSTLLLMNENRSSEEEDGSVSRHQSEDHSHDEAALPLNQDIDLDDVLKLKQATYGVTDQLIAFYFEYCNWIYRHVNQDAFMANWERYKRGCRDRVTLAIACTITAVATRYMPPDNHVLGHYSTESNEVTGQNLFDVGTTALERRRQDSVRTYSVDLVECLLVRCHYMTLLKADSEEIWQAKSDLLSIGMALGLHRDPGKFRMSREVAERRRWAWWHIILLERWQAFLLGRPLSVASHHFDTQLPSYCDPAIDKTGRLYLPNIAFFKLAFILGDIMDDAVSVRPVPYESVLANDRALVQWMKSLPAELEMDEFQVARSLASDNTAIRRLVVQSVIIRSSFYHIRCTLHRPYAAMASASNQDGNSNNESSKMAQSLPIAVGAAAKLIAMVSHSRPGFLDNSNLAVPGHMNWGAFHCFTAAMFFTFQLISNPEQPGSALFRSSIDKAITTLEQSRGTMLADKALDILKTLAHLHSPEFIQDTPQNRRKRKSSILQHVRRLAFPYHDSYDPRNFGDSPRQNAMATPPSSNSVSPPHTNFILPHDQLLPPPLSAMRTPAASIYAPHPNSNKGLSQGAALGSPTHMSPMNMHHPLSSPNQQQPGPPYVSAPYGMTQAQAMQHSPFPSLYEEYSRYQPDMLLGANMGFNSAEWNNLQNVTT